MIPDVCPRDGKPTSTMRCSWLCEGEDGCPELKNKEDKHGR
jgi:hypothetical protein